MRVVCSFPRILHLLHYPLFLLFFFLSNSISLYFFFTLFDFFLYLFLLFHYCNSSVSLTLSVPSVLLLFHYCNSSISLTLSVPSFFLFPHPFCSFSLSSLYFDLSSLCFPSLLSSQTLVGARGVGKGIGKFGAFIIGKGEFKDQ